MRPTNIGADGIRFRAFFFGLFFLFSIMMMALLTVSGAPLPLRLTVFLPSWIAALSGFQALDGTCVFLAARGACSTELGTRPIGDPAERELLSRRATWVHVKALSAALAWTLLLAAVSILVPTLLAG